MTPNLNLGSTFARLKNMSRSNFEVRPALRNSSRARGERRDAISASHSDEVLLLTLDHAMEAHSLATWAHVHMTSYTVWAVTQTQKESSIWGCMKVQTEVPGVLLLSYVRGP